MACMSFRGARSSNPESLRVTTSGFRVRGFASPWNDAGFGTPPASTGSGRPDPIAVKAVGHPVAELHQREGTRLNIAGVEDREVAAVLGCAPDRRQQPAIALCGILAAGDEYRLGDGVAGRQ